MELYHDFQIKDHYYWTGPTPDFTAKPGPQAAQPQGEAAQYKSWTVIEEDGSTTYYDAKINTKPVILDGMMI